MKEKDIQTVFAKKNSICGFFELKLCKSLSIPFSSVKEHQKKALLQAQNKGIFHKINDAPIFRGQKTRFTNQKPFDCFFMQGDAYVVICFYEPRKSKTFYYVPIDEWIKLERREKRKSATEALIQKAAYTVVVV